MRLRAAIALATCLFATVVRAQTSATAQGAPEGEAPPSESPGTAAPATEALPPVAVPPTEAPPTGPTQEQAECGCAGWAQHRVINSTTILTPTFVPSALVLSYLFLRRIFPKSPRWAFFAFLMGTFATSLMAYDSATLGLSPDSEFAVGSLGVTSKFRKPFAT